jgi:hypothetical protein
VLLSLLWLAYVFIIHFPHRFLLACSVHSSHKKAPAICRGNTPTMLAPLPVLTA